MKIDNAGTINGPKPKTIKIPQSVNGQGPDYQDIIKKEIGKLDQSGTVAPPSRVKSEKLAGLSDPGTVVAPADRDRMLLFEKVLAVIKSLPETNLVREAKVEKIKQLIKSGKYHVSSDKVAESLLRKGSF